MDSMKPAYFLAAGTIVSALFVGAFICKFGGYEISSEPKHWAEFATYLAGTVGTTLAGMSALFLWKTFQGQKTALELQSKALRLNHYKECVDEVSLYFKDLMKKKDLRKVLSGKAKYEGDEVHIKEALPPMLVTILDSTVAYAYLLDKYRGEMTKEEADADRTLRSRKRDMFTEIFSNITPSIASASVSSKEQKELLIKHLPIDKTLIDKAIGEIRK